MQLDKTDKGREEIATRQHHLAPRMRTLLLLIDGKRTVEELLDKATGIGLGEQHIQELLDAEFIVDKTPPPPPPAVEPEPPTEEEIASKDAQILELLYEFYTEGIKTSIGLRGYALQAKVERAQSLKDFEELRVPFLESVLRMQGEAETRRLRDQLMPLLSGVLPVSGNTVQPLSTSGNTIQPLSPSGNTIQPKS